MPDNPRLIRLSELEAIEFPSQDPNTLTVVCMHGYGADMNDLAGLVPEIPVGRPVRWIFPNAPVRLDWGGRAWFEIDVEAFEAAQRAGKPRDLSAGEPAGFAEARELLTGLIRELGASWDKLVLMGFSQGAMMAVDQALRAPRPTAGVAILSGTLVDAKAIRALAPSKKGQAFFQSHGSADPILGFAQALALEKELKAAGWDGALSRFEGGHGIPPEIAAELGAWLHTKGPDF